MTLPPDHPAEQPTIPPAGLSVIGLLTQARQDQRLRWKRGERRRVEDYLARFPALRGDSDAVLDLIYAEFLLREELGEKPISAEYLARFPEHAEALQRQLALHQALAENATSTPSPRETAGAPCEVPTLAPGEAAASEAGPLPPPASDPGSLTTGPEPWPKVEAALGRRVAVPGYEVLGMLGEGGMGVVYKARQVRLNRTVALKMILHAEHAGDDARTRFRREAEAVARLQHPNIVQVFEVGEHDGLPFFSLEFCPGGSLAQQLNGTPWEAKRAAGLVQTLAGAVHAAHQAQVVHRDLKPANVLLAADGQPKITDFGLAKKLDEQGRTQTGSIMGTPSYMAPEQADGRKDVGPPADVYALGAILYELLSGRPPFKAATPLDTVLQVLSDEPVPPRQLQPACPADMETITLKCLQKEPGKRYASAQALSEDLARFAAGQPIVARPVGGVERAAKWVKRNPAIAGLAAAVALVLLAGTGISTLFGFRAEQARRAETARAVTEAEARQEAEGARRAAHRQLIDLSAASGLMAAREGDPSLALLWFARAVRLASDEPELQALNRVRAANWLRQVCLPEANFALPNFQQHQDRVRTFQFSPDGKYLLAAAGSEDHLIWDCLQGRQVSLAQEVAKGRAAAWEPKTGLLAVAGKDGRIRLLAPPTFAPVAEAAASSTVSVLAFSPDGQRLAWGGTEGARVWHLRKKEYTTPLLAHAGPVETLSFSASGRLLATSARDQKARVFPTESEEGKPLFPPVPHTRAEHGLAHGGPDRVAPRFAADDRVLLTVESVAQHTHRLVWHSAANGKPLAAGGPPAGQTFLTAFAVSPRGDQVAAMWEDNGCLWDARTQQLLATVSMGARYNWCEDVAFAPDGKTFLTCGHNMRAQFWAVEPRPNGPLLASSPAALHPMKVVRATLSPDGRHLATALWDGTIYLWRMPGGLSPTWSVPAGGTTLPVLSPDGRFVLPGGTTYRDGTQRSTRVYRAETGAAAGPVLDPGGILLNAVFSPDGSRVATAGSTGRTIQERSGRRFEPDGQGGAVHIWDWKTGKRLAGPIPTPGEPRGLAYRPNGRTLAAVCADYRVVLIDPRTGAITHHLDPDVRTRPYDANLWWGNGEARFSPDGRFLVTWEMAPPVHVWDPDTGRRLHVLAHDERVESVAFSPVDPAVLATAGRDSVARVWDLGTGALLAQMPHPSQLSRVRFSPDDKDVITSCADGMLRAWDWRAEKLIEGLALHTSQVMDFGFGEDRRWLVTLGREDLQLTDWQAKTPAGPLWALGKNIHLALAIAASDCRVVVGGFTGSLEAYDLKAMTVPTGGTAEDLLGWSELVAGRRILSQGNVVPLSSAEWAERWQQLPHRDGARK